MIEITMPRLSDTMEEGAIARWYKHPGDEVRVGDTLVEIETDKATMEYEAYEAGTLARLLVEEGENVPIGAPIAWLDDGTTTVPDRPAPTAGTGAVPASDRSAAPAEPGALGPDAAAHEERRFASPLVRKLARDHHLDLGAVHGSGPGGRIIRRDVETLLPASGGPAPTPVAPPAPAVTAARPAPERDDLRASEATPLSTSRRVIARRLAESARTIPHFTVTAVADAEALIGMRADLNDHLVSGGRGKVSINDLLVRAAALALREHPAVNVTFAEDGDHLLVHHRVNVGVAVASENWLVVPVILDADRKTVTGIGEETRRLVALAQDKKLTPAHLAGGTFTISNLGMLGVEQFTALINPPESAILAVGSTTREAVVVGDAIEPRFRMRYTLSADHRAIDGALAARFLQSLTRLIEDPWTILA